MEEDMRKEDELLDVSFNQDNTRLVCASNSGAQVFSCTSLKPTFSWREAKGGAGVQIAAIEGMHRLFLVGGGEFPFCTPDICQVWDEMEGTMRMIRSPKGSHQIKGLQVISDAFAIVLEDEVQVLNTGMICKKLKTISNPSGICAMSPGAENGLTVATLGSKVGEVIVYSKRAKELVTIQAHKAPLKCLALSQDGSLLATASNKGTLIRIFSANDGTKLQEVRRGKDAASITSLALSPDNRWLVLASDKQTVHLFTLNCREAAAASGLSSSSQGSQTSAKVANPSSSLSFIRGVLPSYFSSEWSFAQFHLPTKSRAVAVFSHEEMNTILVACYNGSFYKLKFDPFRWGEMQQVQTASF